MKKIISIMIVATMLLSLCVTAVSATSNSVVTLNVYSELYTGTPAPASGTFKGTGYDVYKVTYKLSGVDSAVDKITSLGISLTMDDSTKVAAKSWLAPTTFPPAAADANGFVSALAGVTPGVGKYAWADNNGFVSVIDMDHYADGPNVETLPFAETLIYVTEGASVTLTYSSLRAPGEQATSYAVIDDWSGGNERSFDNATFQFKINGVAGNTLTLGSSGSSNFVAQSSGDVSSQNLTDLNGNAVTELSKNYGITKITTESLNPLTKRYYLLVTDTNNVTNEADIEDFEIDFGAGGDHGVYETSGDVSFYALVHSTTHVIKSIALQVVDR